MDQNRWYAPTVLVPKSIQSHQKFLWRMDRNGGGNAATKSPQWARIKVEGDGTGVPKEVMINDGSLQYTMQIWTESMARVCVGQEQSGPNYL